MRILYVHNGRERFVLDDLRLLRQEHTITDWHQPGRRFDPMWLTRLVHAHDLVLCWFASWHSLFPVLIAGRLSKPSVVIVGGYDTANLPETDYGSQRGGMRRHISRLVMNQATHLITNSHSARREAIANAGADPAKVSVVYHGVTPLAFGPLDGRERLALTVGNCDRPNLLRKGLQPFVQAAAYLPDVQFVHAGRWRDDSIHELRRLAGANVKFMGFLPDTELAATYARASVYVQASLHEGFGLSVAEAMLAGCIPVVSRAGALQEVVGETGVYTGSLYPAEIAAAIDQALQLDGQHRERARERVLAQFSMERRQQRLYSVVEGVVDANRRHEAYVDMEQAERYGDRVRP